VQIAAIRLFVPDVAAAKPFYGELLGLPVKADGSTGEFCIFDAGGLDLVIESVPHDAPAEDRALVGRFTGVSFRVRDLASHYERLMAAGVLFSGVPEQQAWGGRLATMRDPGGNELQLVEYPA
jgi:catechol 2,3-dioxygenase-like lactoylglutathione lyase family enzyme